MDPKIYQKMLKVRAAEDLGIKKARFLRKQIRNKKGEWVDFKLRNYQIQMVFHTLLSTRFVLGDDCGLGKTLEAIATMACLWEKDRDLKIIVVTNTSVMRQWGNEIDKFTQGIKWRVAEGGPNDRADLYDDYFESWDEDEPEVLIMNYHRAVRDKRQLMELTEGQNVAWFCDEITALKNPDSQTHSVFREFSLRCATRFYGLTATLIKNNLSEGFGIYRVVQPTLFRSKKGFYRNFCVTRMQRIPGSRRKAEVIVGHKPEHIEAFRKVIDPYYLGRAKHTVADELPVLTTRNISIPMEYSQSLYYQDALDGMLTLNEGDEEEEIQIETTKLTQLIYCQEIVDSPYLIGNDVKSGKENYFLSLLKEEFKDEKVIVFTRFKSMVNRFQELLEKDGYSIGIKNVGKEWHPDETVKKGLVRVTGDEDSAMRDAGARAFTHTDTTNLIFITMAGIEAINLQEAAVMIFYDLPWSAGDYIQAVGRMIRIGSPHQRVMAVHLLAETPEGNKTIDHHVLSKLNTKMGYIEATLGERLVQEKAQNLKASKDNTVEDDVIKFKTNNVSDLFDLLRRDAQHGGVKHEE